MAAPRTVELTRRVADSSTTIDQRLEAVMERINQVDDESSGHFVQMKEFISDSFRTAQSELTKGLDGLRAEMTTGLDGLRAEMTEGFTGVDGRFDRLEGKLDRALSTRSPRPRRPKRGH